MLSGPSIAEMHDQIRNPTQYGNNKNEKKVDHKPIINSCKSIILKLKKEQKAQISPIPAIK